MTRLGAILAIFGFGSALLHFTSVQFRLLMWSEPWQPFLGLGIGALGAVFLAIPMLMNKDQPEQGQQGFAPPPPGYPPPPASPPGGFAQPQYAQPPGYGPPNPGYQGAPQDGYPLQAQQPIPQQGPQYGQRPPQGPPPQRGPGQNFGPQGGPPFGPQGR